MQITRPVVDDFAHFVDLHGRGNTDIEPENRGQSILDEFQTYIGQQVANILAKATPQLTEKLNEYLVASGNAEMRSGNFASAYEFYNEALRYDPQDISLLISIIHCTYEIGANDSFLQYARSVKGKYSEVTDHYAQLLSFYMAVASDFIFDENYEAAEFLLEEALVFAGENTKVIVPIFLGLANIQFKQGEYKKAAEYYDCCLKLQPSCPEAEIRLGQINSKYIKLKVGKYKSRFSSSERQFTHRHSPWFFTSKREVNRHVPLAIAEASRAAEDTSYFLTLKEEKDIELQRIITRLCLNPNDSKSLRDYVQLWTLADGIIEYKRVLGIDEMMSPEARRFERLPN